MRTTDEQRWHANRSNQRRRIAFTVAVLGTMLFTPTVAQAYFSGVAEEAISLTTAVLAAPDANGTPHAGSCVKEKSQSIVTVAVETYAPVPLANRHELKVISPSGEVVHEEYLENEGGNTYVGYGKRPEMAGTWVYEIRGVYEVPDSANAWAGSALSGTFDCPGKPSVPPRQAK